VDIDDALERVHEGHIIARPLWPDGVVMRLRVSVNAQGFSFGWVAGPELTAPDITAEDWVDLGRLQ